MSDFLRFDMLKQRDWERWFDMVQEEMGKRRTEPVEFFRVADAIPTRPGAPHPTLTSVPLGQNEMLRRLK